MVAEVGHINPHKMRQIKNVIKVIPPFILFGDGIAFLFYILGIFPTFLDFHREIFGHSILTVLYMAYFSYRFKVCLYTWASVVALMLLNILNIIYFFLTLEYYIIYAGIIIFSGSLMTLFYVIQSNTRNIPGGII